MSLSSMTPSTSHFTPDTKLRELIEENPAVLGIMSRFGLSFGFGENTVAQACASDNVHCDSFLAVCALVCGQNYGFYNISLASLMHFLRKAHSHFLDFLLPSIRRKLIEAVNQSGINDVAFLLLKFFDEYVHQVHIHMNHENDKVFTYVTRLLNGDANGDFRITDYSVNHTSMAEKLNELKDIFIRHYHVRDNEILTSALLDIIQCGKELSQHCHIEDVLFIPNVEKLEKSLKLAQPEPDERPMEHEQQNILLQSLTQREKQIIACVARGKANKEIADEMCISIHTVTTYRRNISSKLQIHSPAGLTIFAILNNLIDIRDVNIHN